MQKLNWIMQISKINISRRLFTVLLFIFLLNGCNQLSEGLQRKKFEFLYKLNNYASLINEYTNSITYYSDIDFYEGRMKKHYEDVNRMETVEGWGHSRVLKENLLTTIDLNLKTLETFKQKMLPLSQDIRKEYDIIVVKERSTHYLDALEDEIAKVGKE